MASTFATLGLDPRLLAALTRMGLQKPTPVQSAAIPLALQGKDVLARARTGSGKTIAYCLPIVQKILHTKASIKDAPRGVRAVVLVPSKELVEQVREVLEAVARYCAKFVSVCAISAEGSLTDQKPRLAEQPDIVVATPSRLAAHIKDRNVSLALVDTVVIDEADLVLSFGYEADVRAVMEAAPSGCQALLMSATLTAEVDALSGLVLHNPVVVKIEDGDTGSESNLKQFVARVAPDDKFLLLYAVLRLRTGGRRSLVFVNSIDHAYRVKLFLDAFGLRAAVLNSELPAASRAHILSGYNRGVFDTLVATDEALADNEAGTEDGSTATAAAASAAATGAAAADSAAGSEAAAVDPRGKKSKRAQKATARTAGTTAAAVADAVGAASDEAGAAAGTAAAAADEGADAAARRRRHKDAEYGVARGIDFKGVDMVINFDMARDVRGHVHRIGRTARAGARGQALTLATEADAPMVAAIEAHCREAGQPPPAPYPVTVEQVAGFRYRVTDVLRGVTKNAVRDARLAEIKREIVASERLKSHFEDNPRDLEALRHDKPLHTSVATPHLKHIPSYLAPAGVTPAQSDLQAQIAAKRQRTQAEMERARKRKQQQDPLRSFKSKAPKKVKAGRQ